VPLCWPLQTMAPSPTMRKLRLPGAELVTSYPPVSTIDHPLVVDVPPSPLGRILPAVASSVDGWWQSPAGAALHGACGVLYGSLAGEYLIKSGAEQGRIGLPGDLSHDDTFGVDEEGLGDSEHPEGDGGS
jgi:hypothetical protein